MSKGKKLIIGNIKRHEVTVGHAMRSLTLKKFRENQCFTLFPGRNG